MLNFVVSLGALVTKVYRINRSKQDYIIRDYINLNTERKANAKIEPQIPLMLMNSMLLGEACENSLKHIEARILTDEHEIRKSVSKTAFNDIFRYNGTSLIEFRNNEKHISQYIWVVQY